MKKTYIIPETMTNEYKYPVSIFAASDPHINDDGNIEIPGEGGEGDAGEGCAKDRDGWSNGGLWTLLLAFLFSMTGGMTMRAQSISEPDASKTISAINITLLSGTNVSYTENIDSVTNLPGVGLKVYISTASGKSVDYLYSQMSSVTYTYSGGSVDPLNNNVNANWNIAGKNIPQSGGDPSFTHQSTDAYAWRLEYPHINTNSTSQRVVNAVSTYGINYSVEWDNSLIANRWTCYTMFRGTNGNMTKDSNVARKNYFYKDDAVTKSPGPSGTTSCYTESSTWSRGHLCPSADRMSTQEQNNQTFYMTNMQPQYNRHNSGAWGTLEDNVRDKWSPATGNVNDTLYVVKAATISNVTINGTTSSGIITTTTTDNGLTIVVPKYFYMAFLYYEKASNTYKAFALWSEQKSSNNDSAATVISNRISIDELEARTGIDFFCNLPDDIENEVEATATYWDNSSSAKQRFEGSEADDEPDGEDSEIVLW